MDDMDITHTLAYKKAFNLYLRKGVPIEPSLKAMAAQEHPSTHYIWRTRGDGRVRATHAANNGRIFSWDNVPPTGHPGEDFGCRCTAEPYVRGASEFAYQELADAASDASQKWENTDFAIHYYTGRGNGVTLSETGHLAGVIGHYFYALDKYNDVNAQIVDEARKHASGNFAYDFGNSYSFDDYLYVFGDSVVSGVFTGMVRHENGMMCISGEVKYTYDDTFTDPADIREKVLRGTSDPEKAGRLERLITDGFGSYFSVKDKWRSRFAAEARSNRQTSIYRWG
ncbi:MAG: phage minor head protein [Alphaproteobacteria bacterium]